MKVKFCPLEGNFKSLVVLILIKKNSVNKNNFKITSKL